MSFAAVAHVTAVQGEVVALAALAALAELQITVECE